MALLLSRPGRGLRRKMLFPLCQYKDHDAETAPWSDCRAVRPKPVGQDNLSNK
jgi:hypothetical protein